MLVRVALVVVRGGMPWKLSGVCDSSGGSGSIVVGVETGIVLAVAEMAG